MKYLNPALLCRSITDVAGFDLENNNIFGSSYLVYQNGKVILKKHFGVKNPESGENVDDSTIYRLASMTKPISAVAALILCERGLLSLEDKVAKYIPSFENIHVVTPEGEDLGIVKNPPTVKHLLTHTSGIGSTKNPRLDDNARDSIAGMTELFVSAGLDFEPCSMQAYSGIAAFDVLGHIIEIVSGIPYGEFVRREIFQPCDMRDATFEPTDGQWQRIITMHARVDDKNAVGNTTEGCVFESFPCTHNLAGAGLASTLDDYAKFAKMLLDGGVYNGKRILSEGNIRLMSTPHASEDIMHGNERWGLGVRVITSENYGALPVGTFGWSGAYGSHFWVDPVNKIFAVFMKNSRFDGGSANKSAVRFEKAVFDSLE
ncbi:MAG: beta-lactamase family protein [Clostridia bacterium]|nr:beta-lactamase family protein [Clostridia bacterium]